MHFHVSADRHGRGDCVDAVSANRAVREQTRLSLDAEPLSCCGGSRLERARPPAGELTEGQQRFVLEYVKDGNAAGAARRAGYSHKRAKQQGARLLTYVDVLPSNRDDR